MWEIAKIQRFCSSLPPSLKASQAIPAHSDCFIFWARGNSLFCLHCSTLLLNHSLKRLRKLGLQLHRCCAATVPAPPHVLNVCWMDCAIWLSRLEASQGQSPALLHLCFSSAEGPAVFGTWPLPTHDDLEQSSWEPGQLPSAGLEKTLKLSWPFSSLLKFYYINKRWECRPKEEIGFRKL